MNYSLKRRKHRCQFFPILQTLERIGLHDGFIQLSSDAFFVLKAFFMKLDEGHHALSLLFGSHKRALIGIASGARLRSEAVF